MLAKDVFEFFRSPWRQKWPKVERLQGSSEEMGSRAQCEKWKGLT